MVLGIADAEGHNYLPLVDLRGCWLLPATELTRSALDASLGAPGLPTETPSWQVKTCGSFRPSSESMIGNGWNRLRRGQG